MEELQSKLIELKFLGCSGIKVSFEDEGALLNEVMTMRYLTANVGLDLSLKIGGCEAKRDIIDGIHLGCNTIVAPMIESEYALDKFIQAVKKCEYKNKISCNIETKLGYENFLNMNNVSNLDSVTFGRCDFIESCDILTKEMIDDEYVKKVAEEIFLYGKINGLLCNMGGGISRNSKLFISDLMNQNLLDYFETRYVIFKTSEVDMEKYDFIVKKANEFELEWLKYLQNRYTSYALKDSSRIRMIENRIHENTTNDNTGVIHINNTN